MSDGTDDNSQGHDGDGSPAPGQEPADIWRRRLLHAGAAAVPTIITLQSSVAWAASTCANNVTVPAVQRVRDIITMENSKALIEQVTGLTAAQVDNIAANYVSGNTGGPFPETGDVPDAEVLWLLVTNGSCWVSFCNNTETADGVQQVCNGSM